MKKIKEIIGKTIITNKKTIIAVIITMIISITIGVKAATMFSSSDVIYDNSSSGTTSNTVKEALDELYVKSDSCGIDWDAITTGTCISTSGAVSYALGTAYICNPGDGGLRKFYVLEDNGDSVSLIMSENIGDIVAWNTSRNNADGPVTALAHLESQTSNWTVEATLPTGQQIADAVGNTSWTSGGIYISLSNASWLYDNLDGDSSTNSYGYWTSTPHSRRSGSAWSVTSDGDLLAGSVVNRNNGVRPVITVSKSQLSQG